MKQVFLLGALAVLCHSLNAQSAKVMLITGGHAFDTIPFFQLFNTLEGVDVQHFGQPEANQAIFTGKAGEFDIYSK